jgi:hypothetical protein
VSLLLYRWRSRGGCLRGPRPKRETLCCLAITAAGWPPGIALGTLSAAVALASLRLVWRLGHAARRPPIRRCRYTPGQDSLASNPCFAPGWRTPLHAPRFVESLVTL